MTNYLFERGISMKRFCSLIVVLALMMSMMALQASAVGSPSSFAVFQQISINNGNSFPGYTRALQRFLMCYSEYNRSTMEDNGGTDGRFGPTTHRLTVSFQNACGLDPDGYVGPDTWTAIDRTMSLVIRDSEGSTWSTPMGKVIFSYGYNGSVTRYLSYLDTGVLASTYFHETR